MTEHRDAPLPASERRVKGAFIERDYLRGPRRRIDDTVELLRIGLEFIRGYRMLHFVGPCVTVFGSARIPEKDPAYALAREMGARLASAGFAVMTGGGPGIMEAANRGAWEVGGLSLGVNIVLPHEQQVNRYVDVFTTFQYFFVRKVMLVKYSYAFVILPGGFGTMDEVFNTLTLMQTGKTGLFPVVLMGVAYWEPLIRFLREVMVPAGTIAAQDVDLMLLTDSPAEATDYILKAVVERFGLNWHANVRTPSRWLGERRRRKLWLEPADST